MEGYKFKNTAEDIDNAVNKINNGVIQFTKMTACGVNAKCVLYLNSYILTVSCWGKTTKALSNDSVFLDLTDELKEYGLMLSTGQAYYTTYSNGYPTNYYMATRGYTIIKNQAGSSGVDIRLFERFMLVPE